MYIGIQNINSLKVVDHRHCRQLKHLTPLVHYKCLSGYRMAGRRKQGLSMICSVRWSRSFEGMRE